MSRTILNFGPDPAMLPEQIMLQGFMILLTPPVSIKTILMPLVGRK